jgi:hypothetical protein
MAGSFQCDFIQTVIAVFPWARDIRLQEFLSEMRTFRNRMVVEHCMKKDTLNAYHFSSEKRKKACRKGRQERGVATSNKANNHEQR